MSQETIRKLAERIFTGLGLPERYKKSSMETITAELAPFGALLEAAKPFAKCTMAGSLDPRECAELQKSERWQHSQGHPRTAGAEGGEMRSKREIRREIQQTDKARDRFAVSARREIDKDYKQGLYINVDICNARIAELVLELGREGEQKK